MSVAILLITHEGIAEAMMGGARHVLGKLPPQLMGLGIDADQPHEQQQRAAREALRALWNEHGILILTDLYGATPSNLAAGLEHLGCPVRRVSGLNLPMLLRVLNYAELELDELARIAETGGRKGVVIGHA